MARNEPHKTSQYERAILGLPNLTLVNFLLRAKRKLPVLYISWSAIQAFRFVFWQNSFGVGSGRPLFPPQLLLHPSPTPKKILPENEREVFHTFDFRRIVDIYSVYIYTIDTLDRIDIGYFARIPFYIFDFRPSITYTYKRKHFRHRIDIGALVRFLLYTLDIFDFRRILLWHSEFRQCCICVRNTDTAVIYMCYGRDFD